MFIVVHEQWVSVSNTNPIAAENAVPDSNEHNYLTQNTRVHWKNELSSAYKDTFDPHLIDTINQEIFDIASAKIERVQIDGLNDKINELLIAPAAALGMRSQTSKKRLEKNQNVNINHGSKKREEN